MTSHKHTYSHACYSPGRRSSRYDYLSLVFRNGVRHRFAIPKEKDTARQPKPRLHRLIGRRRVRVETLKIVMGLAPFEMPSSLSIHTPFRPASLAITAEWEETT